MNIQLRILVGDRPKTETLQYRHGPGRWFDVPKVTLEEAANNPDKGTFTLPKLPDPMRDS